MEIQINDQVNLMIQGIVGILVADGKAEQANELDVYLRSPALEEIVTEAIQLYPDPVRSRVGFLHHMTVVVPRPYPESLRVASRVALAVLLGPLAAYHA